MVPEPDQPDHGMTPWEMKEIKEKADREIAAMFAQMRRDFHMAYERMQLIDDLESQWSMPPVENRE